MQIGRHFTKAGKDPLEGIAFVPRTSRITRLDGTVVFEAKDVLVPDSWSQVAVDILAQKYFRRKGTGVEGGERDARQVFHRMAGCWRQWGERHGYFDTAEDGQAFYDEMTLMLARQMAAPNSPQWFNTGLHFAYDISGPAQGHSYVDPATGQLTRSSSAYERPQPHACQPFRALVSTPEGPVAIGDIVGGRQVGLEVYDGTSQGQGTTRVVAVKANGEKPVFRIVLKNGLHVEATADHRVWALDERRGQGSWLQVAELRAGMRMQLSTATRVRARVPAYAVAMPGSMGDTALLPEDPDPQVFRVPSWPALAGDAPVEECEAALAGWLQGDGFVGQYAAGTNRSLTLEFITINDDEHCHVLTCLDRVFPDVLRHERAVAAEDPELEIHRIRLYGEALRPFVEKFNLIPGEDGPEVPKAVLQGGQALQAAYLRALFQADGTVRLRSRDSRSSDVVLTSVDETLIRQVQVLLLNMGIYARLQRGTEIRENRRTPWFLSIGYGEARQRFRDRVGFVSTDKQVKLQEACSEAFPGKALPAMREESILRIEQIGVEPVFDIQTESGQYLSQNVLVHNCFIQSVADDLVNEGGIMDLWTREARIFKYGSGTGTNFSRVRGAEEPLSGGGRSSGLMSFLAVGDRAAGAIKSGGTTRRAAKMVCLDLDHPDIEAFVDWKVTEERKVAMLAAGSQLLRRHWNAICEAVENSTSKDTSPRTNGGLKKALALAKKEGVPAAFLSQCLGRLADGDCDRDIKSYDTGWDGDAYFTVSGMNSNNSVRVPDSFMRALDVDGDFELKRRTDGKVHKKLRARELWKKVNAAAWACADPGVQFDTTINDWHTCPADGRINASNPCVTGDARVATSEGPKRIDQLLENPVQVLGADGQYHTIAPAFPTGTQPVYRLRTRSGFELRLTGEHRVLTSNRGDVPACELRQDDRIQLGRPAFGSRALDSRLAEFLGLALGDGCLMGDQGTAMVTLAPEETAVAARVHAGIQAFKNEHAMDGRGARSSRVTAPQGTLRFGTSSACVVDELRQFAVLDAGSEGKAFTEAAFGLDQATLAAVLRGLFTADGTVADYGSKSQYVGLDSSSLPLLQQVQQMLLAFGIKGKLYRNRRALASETALLPDGKGGFREYPVRQMHSLRLSRNGRIRFQEAIGFLEGSAKTDALADLNRRVGTYRDSLDDAVESVEFEGIEPVFDLTEPATQHFVANGLVVHNCSEYMFLDDTACNLASINLCNFLTGDGGFDLAGYRHAIRLWTVVLEISVLMAQFPSEAIAQLSYDFRTLGLGYANLGAMLMRMGIPYDSAEGTQWCAALTAILTGDAYATSAEMAKQLGTFPGYDRNREPMLRVIRNHRRAAYNAPAAEYESLSVPPQGLNGQGVPKRILEAARESWDRALELGEAHGYRNAQVSVLAPTGTIGLLMDCDTTGVEPDFALVKFKKLAGGGYFKLVNGAIPEALMRLGYAPQQIRDIERYVVGWQQLGDEVPGITRSMLLEKGWLEAELKEIDQKLPTAFDPSFVLDVERLKRDFSQPAVETFMDALSGSMTVEGAPHLKPEHLPIFDCANRCGRKGQRFIAPMGHIRMMGAAQPFLSGAISKTINLPAESTVEDVGDIYRESWKRMLKAVALYRDGSKMSQALATSLDLLDGVETETLSEDGAQADKVAAMAQAQTQALSQQIVRTYRRRLPNRRGGYTQAASVGGTKLYLRTGEYEDGTLGEIFLDIHKEGAAFRAVLNCFAIAVSMGLQHGVPLEEYCDAFLFTRFEPNGMVQGSDTVKFSTSLIDFVFRELAISYLGRYELAQVEPEQLMNVTGKPMSQAPGVKGPAEQGTPLFTEGDSQPVAGAAVAPVLQPVFAHAHAAARPTPTAAQAAREKGYTGDPCPECGHLTLVRNGACLKCQTCGATTGCS